MTPRLAQPSDLRAVIALTHRAYGHYEALIGLPPVPVTEDYVPRIERGEVWLVEDSGELVGLLVLEDDDGCPMIFSVAVSPERQSAGIGRALLRFAERMAVERGHRRIRLYTNGVMERNIAIYSRFGYRETSRKPHPRLPGSIVVNMEKQLEQAG